MIFDKVIIRFFIGFSFLCAVLALVAMDVNAVQPTHQSNKIFLNPFYRVSMAINTNYSYIVIVNPPDGISSIKSAIINFDVYMTPSVTFALFVNGQSCNNPTFVVSTTYAGAGQGRITFDCSNVINKEGTYNLNLRVTQANTGAVSGWLDLTYMNNPQGDMDISGTEYSAGDLATIFVQLKDNFGNPVSNGACYVDIFYPNNGTEHPYTIHDAPMFRALGDDGLYYYDLIAPSTLGVYMLSARCGYSFNRVLIYPPTETIIYPIEKRNSGVWLGSPSVLNSKDDSLYERCDATLSAPCSANYTFNISTYGKIYNLTNINVYFSGEDDSIGKTLTMAYYNGTSFVNLPNVLTFGGTAGSIPTGYDEYLTNSVPLNALLNSNDTIIIRLITTGTSKVFQNWLSLSLLSSTGTIQDLKGSSEMHITNISGNVLSSINITQVDMTNYTQVSEYVWAYFNRTLTNFTYQSCNVSFNITNNLNVSVNGTDLGNVSGQINYLTGEWSMAIELIAIIALFVAALLILIFVKNTGILFISTLMFFADFVMLKGIDGMDMVAYIMLILMFFPIFKIIGIRKKGRESAYVGNY
jgi:hypothetical protein